jgi:hypothetical protein
MIRYVLVGLLMVGALSASACDACGCSIAQSYTGLMPRLGGHFTGIWWQHQRYATFSEDAFTGLRQGEAAYFNSFELRSRFQLHPRWQLSAILPYAYQLRESGDVTRSLSGVGDAVGMLHFLAYSNQDSLKQAFRHRLMLGAGVKLPTGTYQRPGPTEVVNPNFQVGTGSWDALFNLSYTLRYEGWGINLDATYRYNGESPNGYRFGDRWAGVLSVFRLERVGQVELMPSLGLFYEHDELDTENNFYRIQTDGEALLANAGLELFWRQYNLGAAYSMPLQQNLNDGFVEANPRLAVHLNYFF